MDVSTVHEQQRDAPTLTGGDHQALKHLRTSLLLRDCVDVIGALLAAGVKVEQEAVSVDRVVPQLEDVGRSNSFGIIDHPYIPSTIPARHRTPSRDRRGGAGPGFATACSSTQVNEVWMTQPPMHATLLVVEDDAATSEFLIDLLDMEGYATRVAASGKDALAQLTKQSVNAVLLDRRLPDMDGLAVCREIRASIDAAVPVILLTADYNAELEAAARDAGVTEYLPKPFPPDVLLHRIAALVPPSASGT